MKRHPALQDLSRDHFTALLRATHVRRAVDGDDDVPPFQEARRALQDLWTDELDLHFEEEDTTLRPRLGDAPELLARLDQDHADLRAEFKRLEGTADKDAWKAVAKRLIRHARWEEEVLFQWLQEHLDDEGLESLWSDSKRFRMERRGPASIGPA